MGLLTERRAVGVRGIARIGPVIVGVGPFGRVRLSHGGVERVMGIALLRRERLRGIVSFLCMHGWRLPDGGSGKRESRARVGGTRRGYRCPIDRIPEVFLVPKTNKRGQPKRSELPGTLRRSDAKAQRTFAKAHDSALDEYGDEERAHRVGYAALKRTHEKRGDHWEAKDGSGPSDPRSKSPRARHDEGETFGGVDAEGNSKEELYERAKSLGIEGRSNMSKSELARAIARAQD
jgi:cation transport regulator ChaB